ncbi:Os01g0915350, partial [Oryza sativa Japonica Group]
THRAVSNKGQVILTALSLLVRASSFNGFSARETALSSYSSRLLTTISSPIPVARHSEPATLVAIFSSGRVIIGRPAHNISVPVVWPLHNGRVKK